MRSIKTIAFFAFVIGTLGSSPSNAEGLLKRLIKKCRGRQAICCPAPICNPQTPLDCIPDLEILPEPVCRYRLCRSLACCNRLQDPEARDVCRNVAFAAYKFCLGPVDTRPGCNACAGVVSSTSAVTLPARSYEFETPIKERFGCPEYCDRPNYDCDPSDLQCFRDRGTICVNCPMCEFMGCTCPANGGFCGSYCCF